MLSSSGGKICGLSVISLYRIHFNWGKPHAELKEYQKLDKAYTYINVFGPGQLATMDKFLKEKDIVVLFKSKKAANTNHRQCGIEGRWDWSGGYSAAKYVPWTEKELKEDEGLNRNTVVVWEFKDNE